MRNRPFKLLKFIQGFINDKRIVCSWKASDFKKLNSLERLEGSQYMRKVR